jgi:acetylornithine deacetylase/succinyl-diaminopimelate desuccinylase-like protein
MLAIAEEIDGRLVRTRRPIVFAATTGEEGAGDLRGAKYLFSALAEEPAAAIALDGAGDERIVHKALGSRRYHIAYRGPGGHSWAAFGVPNAVHAAASAAAMLASLPLPRSPRTTLSVSRIGGGTSINSIPEEGWLEVDLRSTSASVLDRFDREIRIIVRAAAQQENARRATATPPLSHDVMVIGDRPSGELSAEHPLVLSAIEATQLIDREPELAAASTDANVPIALGLPAIAIGAGGRGGDAHTPAEWYDNIDGPLGIARAMTILVTAAELA